MDLTTLAEDGPLEEESPSLDVDQPVDLRPDLSELGIVETERGVCEDTYENRAILRRADLNFQYVFDTSGRPTGLIAARSKEAMAARSINSLIAKRPVLVNPKDHNSDYMTGLDLLLDDDAIAVIPPWVVGATRKWVTEQERGGPTGKRAPVPMPVRCRKFKNDGVRCMLWSSGRPQDDGLCRHHLKSIRGTGEDVERARRKLTQAAPYAVDVLEELMEHAESEPVRLKASTEILDRAGIRGGQDISIDMEVNDTRDPAKIVAERLQKLADGAAAIQARLEINSGSGEVDEASDSVGEIIDAEVVDSSELEDLGELEDDVAEPGRDVISIFTPEDRVPELEAEAEAINDIQTTPDGGPRGGALEPDSEENLEVSEIAELPAADEVRTTSPGGLPGDLDLPGDTNISTDFEDDELDQEAGQ